jgi:hypothetical protein
VTDVDVLAVIEVASTPPIFADVTFERFEPEIVILVPPLAGPELVAIDVIVGAVGLMVSE